MIKRRVSAIPGLRQYINIVLPRECLSGRRSIFIFKSICWSALSFQVQVLRQVNKGTQYAYSSCPPRRSSIKLAWSSSMKFNQSPPVQEKNVSILWPMNARFGQILILYYAANTSRPADLDQQQQDGDQQNPACGIKPRHKWKTISNHDTDYGSTKEIIKVK